MQMTQVINRRFSIAVRPVGLPKDSDWACTEEPVQEPGEGQFLVKTLYLSLDPAMRTWMREQGSYAVLELGQVVPVSAIGKVIASRHASFTVGDYVNGVFGSQEYAVSDGQGVVKVDPDLAPLPTHLGTLGQPGLTAYFGLLDVARPQSGETVVVSAAAGAVGSTAGQIAKLKGCRVVGIAGGAEKCRFLVERLGFDAAVDYKAEDVGKALPQHCPDGVNVFFDNVGGEILDAVLTRIAVRARIVLCGATSQYNASDIVRGPANYLSLILNRANMAGFLIFDYVDRYPEGRRELEQWLRTGKLHSHEHVVEGFDQFPRALRMLFEGANLGKLVLKVADD
jgi:NADPH-dependent curcumin reductase CurA